MKSLIKDKKSEINGLVNEPRFVIVYLLHFALCIYYILLWFILNKITCFFLSWPALPCASALIET